MSMRLLNVIRYRGFTLIELMVSVSIMLLIAAGAAVSFRNSSTTRYMNQNYYNVLNDLRTAQLRALSLVNNPGVADASKLKYVGVKFFNDASNLGGYTTFRSISNTSLICSNITGVTDNTYALLGDYTFVLGPGVSSFCVFFEMASGTVNVVKNSSNYACGNSPQFDSNCRIVFGTQNSSGTTICRSLGLNSVGLISDGGTTCL